MKDKDLENRKYYTVSEFAKLLGVHRNTVRNYANKGMIRFIQAGNRASLRIPVTEFDRLAKFNLQKVIKNLKSNEIT